MPPGSRELTAPITRRWWASLEAQTEAAYVRRALAGDWPAEPERPAGELALVCRPDLGVYSGLAGLYRTRHGNVRADGAAAVLGRALAYGLRAEDALWFAGLDPLPGPAELAARYGDATGLGVHPDPDRCAICGLIAPGGRPGNTGPGALIRTAYRAGHAAHDRGPGRPPAVLALAADPGPFVALGGQDAGVAGVGVAPARAVLEFAGRRGVVRVVRARPGRKVRTGPNCAVVMSLGDAAELARRHAARAFGAGSA